jgi:CheY-like chemotaxis protein
VLVIEDEESISGPLAEALNREGFNTEVATTAVDGLESAYERRPDVVLLDLMLPDGDGRDVWRELRRRSDVPIIMLTARGLETDRVVGLELGADDYVVKPFSSMGAGRPHQGSSSASPPSSHGRARWPVGLGRVDRPRHVVGDEGRPGPAVDAARVRAAAGAHAERWEGP